ncbi:MAG: hypothetical protein D6730_15110 [Bacteroidetes bacterium]|nr:MAG: hypothetical protein D6730_15110 [Bacteroidota bacterium]
MHTFYQHNIERLAQQLQKSQARYELLSWSRLVVFLAFVGLTFWVISIGYESEGIMLGAVLLVLFMYLIKIHTDVAEKREYLQNLQQVNQVEVEALAGNMQQLDEGREFVDAAHPYSFDLDLFGPASVFQYLNRSSTLPGKRLLARWLQQPPLESAEIRLRQQAVVELGQKTEWCLHVQATARGKMEEMEEVNALRQWLEEPIFYHQHLLYRILMWLMPALLLATLLASGLGVLPLRVAGLLFLAQLGIVGLRLGHTNRQQVQVGKKSQLLGKYAAILQAIEGEDFTSQRMQQLQQQLQARGKTASEAITRLGSISYYLDQRMNALMGVLLNGTLLWDLQCVYRLEKWKAQWADQLPGWLEVIAQTDAYIGLGRLHFNHPDFCLPQVQEGDFVMQAGELGHPLIPAAERVNNDIGMKAGELLIITGANMAGKSTFLRTVGVNLLLAMLGAPVCAQQYRFAPIAMITSVRASDSLAEHESYFYAELKRLKRIIEQLKQGPAFVIVDEMLRGTNSRDKQTGSRKFIEQLIRLGGTGLIATHDLSLGKLAEVYPNKVRNKCFEVSIEGEQLFFDYKLRDGISQNLNATFLMQQMGIM